MVAGGAANRDEEPLSPGLEKWLCERGRGYDGPRRLQKFTFGQSDPTYLLRARSGNYVLRRNPFGALLPKAHAIEREFRILQAIERNGVPAPRVFAYCEDPSVFGAPFYVMEFIEGRIFYDQTLPGMNVEERSAIYDAMSQAVVSLHQANPFEIR